MTADGASLAEMRKILQRTLERSQCSSSDEIRAYEIFELHAANGRSAKLECLQVALEACVFLGRPYLQTYELSDQTVDCSTVSSQAHWLGAAQQIPFIAENQRKAPASIAVTCKEVLPGDVLVKYPDLQGTPDGLHNHVAVALGKDRGGEVWVVESSSAGAASVVSARAFDPRGGIRRFCENPLRAFNDAAAFGALAMARRVSKQGRVGAQRNPKLPEYHFRLPGIDIEVKEGEPVQSPISGILTVVESVEGRWVEVAGERGWVCRLGNCELMRSGRYPRVVVAGEVIGVTHRNISLPWLNTSCLYWEMGCTTEVRAETAKVSTIQPNHEARGHLKCYNPLYMAKLGVFQLPLDHEFSV